MPPKASPVTVRATIDGKGWLQVGAENDEAAWVAVGRIAPHVPDAE